MKIPVLFHFDAVTTVDARRLAKLIESGEVLAFRRASGWVKVGVDPIRGDGGTYGGPERRQIVQRHDVEPANGCHYCAVGSSSEGGT